MSAKRYTEEFKIEAVKQVTRLQRTQPRRRLPRLLHQRLVAP